MILFIVLAGVANLPSFFLIAPACVQADEVNFDDDDLFDDDEFLDENEPEICESCDPLEPLNRFFFQFNDKLYFWALKPVARGYGATVPEVIRNSIKRAFKNLLMPVRLVNNLLQGNLKGSGVELSRFLINSTVGVLGMADPAQEKFSLEPTDEDLGQTLGVYGIGNGIYLCWPFFGPSTLRDTAGFLGDSYLNPFAYLYMSDSKAGVATFTGRLVNDTSLIIGEYESFKESAFDAYLSQRDAYLQYRRNKIKNCGSQQDNQSIQCAVEDGENHRGKQFSEQKFAIQVGAYVDSGHARELAEDLREKNREVTLVEYKRGDYSFYGVQVLVQGNFVTAKLEEVNMANAGFPEAFVVFRAYSKIN